MSGFEVDASLRTDDPSIFACGDVATFWHPLFNQYVRVEAWQNAEDHARVIAKVIMGETAVFDACALVLVRSVRSLAADCWSADPRLLDGDAAHG